MGIAASIATSGFRRCGSGDAAEFLLCFGSVADALVGGLALVFGLFAQQVERTFLRRHQFLERIVPHCAVILPHSRDCQRCKCHGTICWQHRSGHRCKLDGHDILFAQPHLWNDIDYDKNKNALTTVRNTITIMRMVRICVRISDVYTQLRCYKLSCWQPYDCAECDVGF